MYFIVNNSIPRLIGRKRNIRPTPYWKMGPSSWVNFQENSHKLLSSWLLEEQVSGVRGSAEKRKWISWIPRTCMNSRGSNALPTSCSVPVEQKWLTGWYGPRSLGHGWGLLLTLYHPGSDPGTLQQSHMAEGSLPSPTLKRMRTSISRRIFILCN